MKRWQKKSLTALFYALPFMNGAALAQEEKPEAEEPKTEQQEKFRYTYVNANSVTEAEDGSIEIVFKRASLKAALIYGGRDNIVINHRRPDKDFENCPRADIPVEQIQSSVKRLLGFPTRADITVTGISDELRESVRTERCVTMDKDTLVEVLHRHYRPGN